MQTIRHATIYGDSIMNGTVMDTSHNYITIMGETLKRFFSLFQIEANNRSHYGMTITQGQKVLSYDLKKGLSSEYALVEFGGNDCNFKWDEISKRPCDIHLPRTPLDQFQQVLRDMVVDLKANNIKPVLMSLPPIDAEKYLAFLGRRGNDCKNILKWLGDVHMIYRFHESYSHAIEKLAAETNTLIVDVRNYFLDKHNFKNLICEDGIHPNEEGHKLIFAAFSDFAAARRAQPVI